ncbi:MAG: acyclic terpene utilization AtuA family protein [Candidatus Rokubacteria bacterium]|nr:acyclic terpene utilization AtuA family protein [Candidatus Rokubacteria bacterium]
MVEIRVLAPTGMLGTGFSEVSFWQAFEKFDPHFIGCDAGSTDSGPDKLGTGKCQFSRPACKRDLRLMVLAARRYGIPLLVGSAGTAGADPNLAWLSDIVAEIAREEGLHFRLALIHAEQDRSYLKRRLREGRIRPLEPAPELTEAVIDRSEHIVGMMGSEPFVKALDGGADVVLAGRSSDTSIYAAIPMTKGFPPGLVWHAAKILECGAAAVVRRSAPDGMIAWIRSDHFVLEPVNPTMVCSPVSVAAHTLYENGSPYILHEPSGHLDTSDATYEAVSDRAVKVSGSRFVQGDQYTVKLEGAEKVGYQTIVVAGVRDPLIIAQIDDWLAEVRERAERRANEFLAGSSSSSYSIHFRVYGKNGVMGALEPVREVRGHELCLIIEVTASTQEHATGIAASTAHIAVHNPIPQWTGLITGLAFPHAPQEIERGAVYRFNMNHLVFPDDPCEMFPIEHVQL